MGAADSSLESDVAEPVDSECHAPIGTSNYRRQREAKTREELERLRIKLLDFSGRNKFLNFKHSETAATQLRVVNASLTAIQSAIETGQELTVKGLRKPGDEVPLTFALAEERTETIQSENGRAKPRSRRFDATIAAEAARQHGINPEYDLLVSAATAKTRELQSLLFAEELERRLQGIYDKERRSAQELGISTLYFCLGFLEWYEADHSDRQYFAPLILYPIEMKRVLYGTKYRFTIRGVGDDPESNISLIERLSRDFAIRLPTFDPQETSVDNYLQIIGTAVSELRRWRVRPMATVAILNFAKLAMYKDLDPEGRPNDSKLESNSVIVDVLAGGEATQALGTGDEEPDFKTLQNVPLLVTEADSSQFAAVAESLKPQNLVIEGPPGTGKSQTITNIIAGALAKGWRVLFVAEKLAALEVVKSKIDSFGLAPYCLELHSTKARKVDVYQSIGDRLYAKKPANPNIEIIVSDIEQQRRILDEYVRELHAVHGNLGETVHSLLWKEQRLRLELASDAAGVEHIHITKAEEYSPGRVATDAQVLDGYEGTAQGIAASYSSPAGHPWFGFTAAAASLDERRQVVQRLIALQQELSSFAACCKDFASNANIRSDLTAEQWLDISSLACALAGTHSGLPADVLGRLRDDDAIGVIKRLIQNIEDALSIERLLGAELLSTLTRSEAEYRRLESLAEATVSGESVAAKRLADIKDLINALGENILELRSIKDCGLRLEAIVGEISRDVLDIVQEIRSLLDSTERRILSLKTDQLVLEENQATLEEMCDRGSELRHRFETVKKGFDLQGLGGSDQLREYARSLREAGFLWWLNSKVKEARRLYKRCCYDGSTRSNDAIAATFVYIADTLDERNEFDREQRYTTLLGASFSGLETPFDAVRELVAFVREARRVTAGQSRANAALRSLLLSAGIEKTDQFLDMVHDPSYERLWRYLRDGLWNRLDAAIANTELNKSQFEELMTCVSADRLPASSLTIRGLFEAVRDSLLHRDLHLRIDGDGAAKEVLRENFKGAATDIQALSDAVSYMSQLNAARRKLPIAVLDRLASFDSDGLRAALASLMPLWLRDATAIAGRFNTLERLPEFDTAKFFGRPEVATVELAAIIERLRFALNHAEALDDWARYLNLRARAVNVGGNELINHYEKGGIQEGGARLSDVFNYLVIRSVVRSAIEQRPALRNFPGVSLDAARERFRDLDKKVIETQRAVLAWKLHTSRVDPGNNAGPRGTWTGLALLSNEVNKQRRHVPIRDVVQRAGPALQQVKPCFMMSPLSVAQYLPPGSIEFDLVVIDEASQMKPEDALGALSRGKNAVVVGDPKQLPPTSFFEREIDDEDVADEDAVDNESILSLAMAQYGKRRLRWHYRSRHESLIAFSNHHFYQNDLIVFPSPAPIGTEHGVRSHFVGGAYKSGTNPDEARAVTEAALRFMKDSPHLSLGIVAVNREQRELIYDEITRLIATNPDAAKFVERWEPTLLPFFVKNLESVQGDERDVIFISTVYGAESPGGAVAQRFGPILGPSGWRRLNVLFTRARVRVEVFTSMNPADIRVDEKSGLGIRAFHDYLEYAATGRLESGSATRRRPDSDFEIAVARLLEAAGYEVEPQVGVAHYYVDLAVRHPRSGTFILGIECDGATYHSAKSARDRDRTREEALRALGWSLYRIWSTDWFADPRREFVKLDQFLKGLL